VVSSPTFTRVRPLHRRISLQLLTHLSDLLPKKTAKPGKGPSQEL
jgi:hypothetical protein